MQLQMSQADSMLAPRAKGRSRERILDAARLLLRRQSYEALSMEAVADAARLTRRTIYNQFVGRQALYRASRESLARGLGGMLEGEVSAALPPREALLRFADATLAALSDDRHAELMLSLLRDTGEAEWLREVYRRQVQAPVVGALSAYLARLIGFSADTRAAAHQFAGLLEAMAVAPRLFAPDARMLLPSGNAQLAVLVDAFLAQHRAAADAA